MNNVRLFSRSLIIATALFSLAKIEASQPNIYRDFDNGDSYLDTAGYESRYLKGAVMVAANVAGFPNWALAGTNALADAFLKATNKPKYVLNNKKDFAKAVTMYAVIDAAKRYALDFACDKIAPYAPSAPTFIAQKVASIPQSVQTFFSTITAMVKNFGQPMLHDIFTRRFLFGFYNPKGMFGFTVPSSTQE